MNKALSPAQILVGFILMLGAPFCIAGMIAESGSEDRAVQKQQTAQTCARYEQALISALEVSPLRGKFTYAFRCDDLRTSMSIKVEQRRQPSAYAVLSDLIVTLVANGINPARDNRSLSLYVNARALTATGADGVRPLSAAMYDPFRDHVSDETADWLRRFR